MIDPSDAATDRRIALLIDATTFSHTKIAAMLAELSKYGTANIRRAYGDWARAGLKGWTEKLHEFAIRPIQQFSYSTGKTPPISRWSSMRWNCLYTQKPDAFCIASSDADFTPLVMQLKANGLKSMGSAHARRPFLLNACTTFLYLEASVIRRRHRRWPILQLCQVPRRNPLAGRSKSGGVRRSTWRRTEAGGGPARSGGSDGTR